MIRVGIIGASGYAGGELVRYLLGHPGVRISYLSSGTYKGQPISNAYPSLIAQDLPLCEEFIPDLAADEADIFFQAHGNGTGMAIAEGLLSFGKRLIDMPADFRLKDTSIYKHYYGKDHTAAQLLPEAVYGICELHADEIAAANIVANPGCYATGAILALAPLVANKLVDLNSIIVDSKSGVSGAGRSKLEVAGLFAEINEGVKAYAVAGHRHTPEIEQEMTALAGTNVKLTFTPHLIPMNRGILTTAYANLAGPMSSGDILDVYETFYEGKPFVAVLEEGKQPVTKNVLGSNYCHIGAAVDERTGRVIVTSAIDNMGKGAAGQAVQSMNLMCGFDEDTALTQPAVYP